MNKIILLLALSLVGCGKGSFKDLFEKPYTYNTKYASIDPTFNSLVQSYETTFNVNINIPINFDQAELNEYKSGGNNVVGVCVRYGNDKKEIFIDPTFWGASNTFVRQNLLWHELGHCIKGLPHNEKTYRGYPVSIMYPMVLSSSIFTRFFNGYVDEHDTGSSANIKADIDHYLN